MSTPPPPKPNEYQPKRLARLRQVLLLAPLAAVVFTAFLGLHAALTGRASLVVAEMMTVLFIGTLALGGIVGGLYVLFPTNRMASAPIAWRTLLASGTGGAVVMTILYLSLSPAVLQTWLTSQGDILLAPVVRGMLGVLDGYVLGVLLGFTVSYLDPKATQFTPTGLMRYGVMLGVCLLIAGLVNVVNESGAIGDALSSMVGLILLGLAKLGVNWWDSRATKRR